MPHDNVIANLIPHIAAWWGTITVILTLCGFLLFMWSITSLAAKNGRRSTGRIILALVSAILLVNIGGLLDALSATLLGGESVHSLSYQAPDHPARYYIQFAIYLVALIGLIGIGRGIIILKDCQDQPGRLTAALAHIFGGILCVNLVATLKIMGRSMGREVLELITSITG
jgi:hypothetical protein